MEKTINGIAYRKREGEGTPLIFIHGWLGSNSSWSEVEEKLDVKNPLIFYDQRCHGESFRKDFNITTLSKDLESLIKDLNLDKPVLIGHSLGGMVALKYAVRNQNYKGLFLAGTSASTPEPENRSVQYFIDAFHKWDREKWSEEIMKNYAPSSIPSEIEKETKKQLMKAEPRVILDGLKAMNNYDLREKLKGINKPAEIVAGRNDAAVTPEKSKELAEILDCQIHLIDSSHLILQEKPGDTASFISNFLHRV